MQRKTIAEEKSDKEDGSGLEDNLENFMTIDSVGEMEGKFLELDLFKALMIQR